MRTLWSDKDPFQIHSIHLLYCPYLYMGRFKQGKVVAIPAHQSMVAFVCWGSYPPTQESWTSLYFSEFHQVQAHSPAHRIVHSLHTSRAYTQSGQIFIDNVQLLRQSLQLLYTARDHWALAHTHPEPLLHLLESFVFCPLQETLPWDSPEHFVCPASH